MLEKLLSRFNSIPGVIWIAVFTFLIPELDKWVQQYYPESQHLTALIGIAIIALRLCIMLLEMKQSKKDAPDLEIAPDSYIPMGHYPKYSVRESNPVKEFLWGTNSD